MGKLYCHYVRSHALSEENAPEYMAIVADIMASEKFRLTENFVQHADISLRQHMTSVSYLSYLKAKSSGLNFTSAARAALVHDLVDYDWHIAGDGSHRLHGYRHPGFAVKNASRIFPLSALEKNIIKRHMWPLTPIPPKYAESFIVTMADKYCAVHEIMIKKLPFYRKKFLKDLEGVKA